MEQIIGTKVQISLTFSMRVTEDAIQPKTLLEEGAATLQQQNRRLLLAVITQGRKDLEQIFKYMLALYMGQYEIGDWEKLLPGHAPLLEELLLPVIKTLGASDAAALQADIKDGSFFPPARLSLTCSYAA